MKTFLPIAISIATLILPGCDDKQETSDTFNPTIDYNADEKLHLHTGSASTPWRHPELRDGERLLINISIEGYAPDETDSVARALCEGFKASDSTVRLGIISYDSLGNVLPGKRPIFTRTPKPKW